MQIRKSTLRDLDRIMEIYACARRFMAEHGNPDQWGPTCWPPEALIRQDIAGGNSYVCLNGAGDTVGTFFFVIGADVEPTYRQITDGAWLDESPYGVVHRIASDGTEKGVGSFCINWAYGRCGHLRIDTHGDNAVMQALLRKLGFIHCGTIYVEEDDAPRLAYEKSERCAEKAGAASEKPAAGPDIVRLDGSHRDAVAPLIAAFRVSLRSLKGIPSSPDEEAAKEEFSEFLQAGYPVYAAVQDGKMAGYIVCRIEDPVLWVEQIYVPGGSRRQGIASRLFEKAEELAASMGEDTVFNWIHPNNEGMIGFLRSKGYTVLNMIEVRKPYRGEKPAAEIAVGGNVFDY